METVVCQGCQVQLDLLVPEDPEERVVNRDRKVSGAIVNYLGS